MFDIADPIVGLLGLPNLGVEATLDMSAQTDMSASAIAVGVASVAMSADGSLAFNAVRITEAVAMSSAESSLTATGIYVGLGVVAMTAETSLSPVGGIVYGGASDMSAETALSATATYVVIASTVSMSGESNMPAITPEPIYRLILPTVEYAYSTNILLARYPIANGVSLVIDDGVGELREFVDQNTTLTADYYFGGGRNYQLTPTQYTAVDNAGFGYLVEVA